MPHAAIAEANRLPANPTARCLFLRGSVGLLIGLLAGILVMFVTGTYTNGFSGADESGYFLNSCFICSYLKRHVAAIPLGIHNLIVAHTSNEPALSHSQLVKTLQLPESSFKHVALLPHGGRLGTTEVYASAIGMSPDLETVRQQGIPDQDFKRHQNSTLESQHGCDPS